MTRKLFVVVAVGVALLMQAEQGQAQETVQFVRVVEAGTAYDVTWTPMVSMLVVIEDDGLGTTTLPAACGLGVEPLSNVRVVVISPGQGSELLTIAVVSGTLRKGDRLVPSSDICHCGLDSEGDAVSCSSFLAVWRVWGTEATLKSRSNSSPLLFTASGEPELGGIDQAIITGRQDEDGFADVVITRKGEKPIRTVLHADFPLEPSDRIVDILELDYDPITGLSLYGAYVEY